MYFMRNDSLYNRVLAIWAREYRGLALTAILLYLLQLPVPYITRYVVDSILVPKKPDLLVAMLVMQVAFHGILIYCSAIQSLITNKLALAGRQWIADQFLGIALTADLSLLANRPPGSLHARLIDGQQAIGSYAMTTFLAVSLVIQLLSLPFMVSRISPTIALGLVLIAALQLGSGLALTRRAANERASNAHTIRTGYTRVFGLFAALPFYRSLLANSRVHALGTDALSMTMNAEDRCAASARRVMIWNQILQGMGSIAVAYWSYYLALRGVITLGEVMAIAAFAALMAAPVKSILEIYQNLRTFGVLSQSYVEAESLARASRKTAPASYAHDRKSSKGSLRVIDLGVCYQDNTWAIRSINLSLALGQLVVVKGPCGSGKSTLVNVMAGLLEPTNGRVLLGDVDIFRASCGYIEDRVSYVSQSIDRVDMTIEDYLSIGVRESSKGALERILHDLGLDSVIQSLPEGIRTRLGEGGVLLSRGQQQLLSVARALYEQRTVLLLDEPTGAMDVAAQRRVMRTLRVAGRDRLVVVVTHSAEADDYADMIITLESGIIVEVWSRDDMFPSDYPEGQECSFRNKHYRIR